jgi:hypothetical protein
MLKPSTTRLSRVACTPRKMSRAIKRVIKISRNVGLIDLYYNPSIGFLLTAAASIKAEDLVERTPIEEDGFIQRVKEVSIDERLDVARG